jgi:hypothetical protein
MLLPYHRGTCCAVLTRGTVIFTLLRLHGDDDRRGATCNPGAGGHLKRWVASGTAWAEGLGGDVVSTAGLRVGRLSRALSISPMAPHEFAHDIKITQSDGFKVSSPPC